MENTDLMLIRVKSFGMELFGLLITGILGFVFSPAFQTLVSAHFGETIVASLISLVVIGLAKHLRNLSVVKNLGGEGEKPMLL